MGKVTPVMGLAVVCGAGVLMQMVAGVFMDATLTVGVGCAAYGLGLITGKK